VFADGIVSYDVPQGYYNNSLKGGGDYEDFRDSLYDGQLLVESNNSSGKIFLSGGRGILTDKIVGQKDFTQSKGKFAQGLHDTFILQRSSFY